MEHIWGPFERAGEPVEDMPAIAHEIREKRALAVSGGASVMAHAIEAHIDRAIMAAMPPPDELSL
jgi:hypothetical protein